MRDIEIALVNLRDPRQRVEILDRRRFRIVDDLRRSCEKLAPGNFLERLAVGVIDDLIIEFAANDEIDRRRWRSAIFSGSTVTGGPTKQTFSFGFDVLHHLRDLAHRLRNPGVEVNSTSNSKSFAISTVCSMEILCGGASTTLLSGSMPAG